MDTYKILGTDDITKICEETYNLLKDYCLTTNSTRWTIGHVQFGNITSYSSGCWFDILSKYDQEPLGKCEFSIETCSPDGPSSGYMTVSFRTYQEDIDEIGNVYPKIDLPPSRYEYPDDLLGRYFYLLVDELYCMTAFQAARLKFFLQMVK